jgi:hypothetical protein
VITILVDHDIEGQALTLWGTLTAEGWLTLLPLQLVTFAQIGLPVDSSDRTIWRTAQARGMVLLTHNRNMRGDDSLEQTIREENTLAALPVVTIGRIDRIRERSYRERCAVRLVEIGLDIETYLGVGRIFIPWRGWLTNALHWTPALWRL